MKRREFLGLSMALATVAFGQNKQGAKTWKEKGIG